MCVDVIEVGKWLCDVKVKSPTGALLPFLGGGFPYQNRQQKRIGYSYSNLSNLEHLAGHQRVCGSNPSAQDARRSGGRVLCGGGAAWPQRAVTLSPGFMSPFLLSILFGGDETPSKAKTKKMLSPLLSLEHRPKSLGDHSLVAPSHPVP